MGKTFVAKRLAWSIMGEKNENRVKFIQFHQNYSYEDFIGGFKPTENGGFKFTPGVFYNFCEKAKDDDRDYYFIIDEINRGNMSKIFGEVLMLIENDKRKEEYALQLAYEKEIFSVPENVHIIGMMNTADRSLAMIDYALRRRFCFYEMKPAFDSEGFKKKILNNQTFVKLIDEIKELNEDIKENLGKGFCIGHSYFSKFEENCTKEDLQDTVKYEIIPLLEEYWFDNEDKLNSWENRLIQIFK